MYSMGEEDQIIKYNYTSQEEGYHKAMPKNVITLSGDLGNS
jgi:hypothetical protein